MAGPSKAPLSSRFLSCDGPMLLNLLAFVVAAFLEIAGCFAFWKWLRDGHPPLVAVAGLASLGTR